MADTRKAANKPSVDSSPLDLAQLSDEELMIIFEIERRLDEALTIEDAQEPSRVSEQSLREGYLARVEERYPRVLLLDGGRGTGKTSILLTLVKRWSVAAGLWDGAQAHRDSELENRIERLKLIHPWIPEGGKSPGYVRVVPILDFDPLPAEMPLVAGIIQAWRLLAERYDSPSRRDDICNDDQDTLLDVWHTLFRVAAVGWTAIPKQSGLIEQVLDQEEQVRDWQRLDKQWRKFVNLAIERGKRLSDRDKLDNSPVFVIMIDDVDLQVGRIRELLPALRMLYHPRVFFLVAADRRHMIDMLKLDFLGKQNELARHTNAQQGLAVDLAALDRWASDLAESAFEKVFPRRSRWNLKRLNLLEFLAFQGHSARIEASKDDRNISFLTILNQIERRSLKPDDGSLAAVPGAGTFIQKFGEAAGSTLPGVMTYRAVHHLREYIESIGESGPAEVLARLLSGNGDALEATIQYAFDGEAITRDNTTQGQDNVDAGVNSSEPSSLSADKATPQIIESVAPRGDKGNAAQTGHLAAKTASPLQSQVDVAITGRMVALYRAGPTELAGDYNIVLSARPDFVFTGPAATVPTRMSTTDNRFNFTAALTAIALQDAGFPVDATGIGWDTYLSLAWTEWPTLGLSFVWPRHVHPRPDQLFEQTNSWSKFLRVELEPGDKLERFAYSWIYHQRCWSTRKADVADPVGWTAESNLDWRRLLRFRNLNDAKLRKDSGLWLCRTLPLLARPEIGFPPHVHRLLLRHVLRADVTAKLYLKRQRRRLVTDAYVAAEAQRGRVVGTLPEEKIEGWISTIDKSYEEAHGEPSLWSEIEEVVDPSGPSK